MSIDRRTTDVVFWVRSTGLQFSQLLLLIKCDSLCRGTLELNSKALNSLFGTVFPTLR